MILSSNTRPCVTIALLATLGAALPLSGCGTSEALFSRRSLPQENVQMSASEAITATQEWAAAYAKKPEDTRNVLGYARALRALGSDDKALEVLKTAFEASPTNGDIAAELGRLALEMNHLEIAKPALEMADQQAVRDWKTLSAQGTLRAKQGRYDQAQHYYLAALDSQPDAVSVINNLALSYLLDGKAQEAEDVLRKAISSGRDDKRLRQNLALALGLQGKFTEARQYASADMSADDVKANIAYLRNMVSSSTQLAAAKSETAHDDAGSDDDWQPFASNRTGNERPVQRAAVTPKTTAKVQMVKPVDEVGGPAPARAGSANTDKMTGQPTLTKPGVASSASFSPGDTASLLRTDID
jgi:Flp pilus assembly protein TadD